MRVTLIKMNDPEAQQLREELQAVQQRHREEEAARQAAEAEAAAQRAELEALRAMAAEVRDAAQARAAGQDPNIMLAMQGRGLTDAQFQVFIDQLNTNFQDGRVADERRHERQRVNQLARDEVKSQTKRIRPCDGTNANAVREYLTEIELARPYVGNDHTAINKIVANTAQGGLKKSFERFMSAQANRDNVAWEAVRNHIRAAFLSQDEQEHLRTSLEKVRQTQYEGNTAYTRRFLEAADDAYPPGDRTAGDDRVILNLYVRGLRDSKIVERLVQETRPDDLQEAIEGVEQFTADMERFQRFGWASEPGGHESMEVGVIRRVNDSPCVKDTGLGLEEFIKSLGIPALTQQLKGVQSELGKIKSMINKPSTSSTPPSKSAPSSKSAKKPSTAPSTTSSSHTPKKKGPCYVCGKGGHWARDCYYKKGQSSHSTFQGKTNVKRKLEN